MAAVDCVLEFAPGDGDPVGGMDDVHLAVGCVDERAVIHPNVAAVLNRNSVIVAVLNGQVSDDKVVVMADLESAIDCRVCT